MFLNRGGGRFIMPPKFKFSRIQVISGALEIVQNEGMGGLTARALASRLGSSAKPIFGLFKNMEEVQQEVIKAANTIYQSYLSNDISAGKYPPYKASGMAYVRFAREKRELFKLLFMCDRSSENIEEDRESILPLLDMIQKNLGIGEDEAYLFHLEMWIYVHGIATMIATSYLDWEWDVTSDSMTDLYQALLAHYGKKAVQNGGNQE